jgi:tRNA nucleotidyltransferase (CCA-adding enzyme)
MANIPDWLSDNIDLQEVRQCFLKEGFDIRIVGGAVRDYFLNIDAHDIDFCTNANPEQQIEIYRKYGIRYVETGLQHGTLTVVKNSIAYEITSLRTELDHDGRHATVSYTGDWLKDLERRDLTVNAMSMTFEGEIIDPFGGMDDLKNNRIRFVGNPGLRIQEDYLRILRWLRFHGRLASGSPLDSEAQEAVLQHGAGLSQISRERIWAEMQKIISNSSGVKMLKAFYDMGLAGFSSAPLLSEPDIRQKAFQQLEEALKKTQEPVALITCFLSGNWDDLKLLSERWKWSSQEAEMANFLCLRMSSPDFDARDGLANKKWKQDWTSLACRLLNREDADFIGNWEIPIFPVNGEDMKKFGYLPGPGMGKAISKLRGVWTAEDYQPSRETLLGTLEIPTFKF